MYIKPETHCRNAFASALKYVVGYTVIMGRDEREVLRTTLPQFNCRQQILNDAWVRYS